MKKLLQILALVIVIMTGMIMLPEHEPHVHAASYKCPVCGHDIIPAAASQPTCTQAGRFTGVCAYCEWTGTASLPALGHDYRAVTATEATCTQAGRIDYTCSRCGDSYSQTTGALGHSYVWRTTKEATCTEDGTRTYTCSRCSDSYVSKIAALGHDWKTEEVEATCTQAGHKKSVCQRCNEEELETYPALGHDLGKFTVSKPATCTEAGSESAVCQRCNETITKTIAALGHKFPDEWTVEKEASYFATGLLSKTCSVCGARLEQIIPRKDLLPVIGTGAAILLVLGGAFLWYRKYHKNSKVRHHRLRPDPSFEDKTVLICSKEEGLTEALKDRPYLQVSTCEKEELAEQLEENDPDLLIIDIANKKELERFRNKKQELYGEKDMGIIVTANVAKRYGDLLKELKEERRILNWSVSGRRPQQIVLDLIVPVLHPKGGSDASLSNVAAVADLLGLPYVGKIIDVYVSGRQIKDALSTEEAGISEGATVIGAIASLLGADTVAGVAGLVDDLNALKAAGDEEAGAYEARQGLLGGLDAYDVLSGLLR